MTRSKLFLIAAASTLMLLAMACGSALDYGGSESELRSGDGGDGEFLVRSQGDEAPEALEDGYGVNYEASAFDSARGVEEPGPPVDSQLGSALDRKIIQSTSVDLELDGENGVSRSFQEIIRIAETAGGFVASSSFSNIDEQQFADVTIRVPSNQYQGVLADIRGMGTVSQEGSDANDVTEEYTDLAARLRTLSATEQRYLELLARADTINDILVVQDRLDVVRGQTEQVIGRINLLDNLADLATITVHLSPVIAAVEPPAEGSSLSPVEAFQNSWETSLVALRGIAIGAMVVVAFSWLLIPPLVALAIGARWWAGRSPRPATETPVV